MDFIFEFIVELIFEGSIEISSNKKISKWIRYPILCILILFFSIIIFGLIIIGLILMKENFLISLLFIIIGLFLLIGSINKFKKIYLNKK